MRARDRDQRLVARGDLEATRHGIPAVLGPARRPVADSERFAAHGRDRHLAAALDARPPGAVGKTRLHAPAHRHATGQSLDPANKLPFRSEAVSGERHRVGDACRTLRGGERRLEHVGVGQVSPRDLVRRLGLEREAAASIPVEDGAEDARRVEIGQAEPVDRAVAGHQSRRATVADRRVVPQRRVVRACRRWLTDRVRA